MSSQTGKGRGRGLGKGKPPRNARRPSPAKSRVTSTGAAKGGPVHGPRMELAYNQVSACSVARWDIWPGIAQIAGRVTTLESTFSERLVASWGMTGDEDVSSLVLTTTPQQEVEQGSDFTMSHVPVAVWLSLLIFLEQFFFHWFHRAALSKAKHGCSVGTQTEPEPAPPPSNTATNTTGSADHRERYVVNQNLSLLTSMQHLEPLGEGNIIPTVHSMPNPFGRCLCRVGSFRGGRRQRLCVAGHWSIQVRRRLHDGAVCD